MLVQFEDAAVVKSQAFPNSIATLHGRIERADPCFVAMDQTAIDIDDQVAISLVELLEHIVLICRMTISDASSDNHRSSFCRRGGVGPGRAQTGAAVSGRARARRARLGFCPGSPGSKTRSEHRFLFLFASVDLSGGFVYFVARFSGKSAAYFVARDWVGSFHNDGRRFSCALAHPDIAMGGGVCPGRDCFAARCSSGDERGSASAGPQSSCQHP